MEFINKYPGLCRNSNLAYLYRHTGLDEFLIMDDLNYPDGEINVLTMTSSQNIIKKECINIYKELLLRNIQLERDIIIIQIDLIAGEKQIASHEGNDLVIFRDKFVLKNELLQDLLLEIDIISTEKIKTLKKIKKTDDPCFDSKSLLLLKEVSNELEKTDEEIFKLIDELEEIVMLRCIKDDDVQIAVEKVFAKCFKYNTPSSEQGDLCIDMSEIARETEVIPIDIKQVDENKLIEIEPSPPISQDSDMSPVILESYDEMCVLPMDLSISPRTLPHSGDSNIPTPAVDRSSKPVNLNIQNILQKGVSFTDIRLHSFRI